MKKNKELDMVRRVLIDKVFSFARKIAPVYEALHWSWSETGVPCAEDIESLLTHLINQCEANSTITTGGLLVHISLKDKTARIAFEMEKTFEWGEK